MSELLNKFFMPDRAARVESLWRVDLPQGAELRRASVTDVERVVYVSRWRSPMVAANQVLLRDEPIPIQRKAKMLST